MFGGEIGQPEVYNNETWEWNGIDWIVRNPNSEPSVRNTPAMAFDSERDVTVLFGGQTQDFLVNDETWEYSCDDDDNDDVEEEEEEDDDDDSNEELDD